MNEEIWKDIPEWEGYYQISNLGRIKSLFRKIKWRNTDKTVCEKILKPRINSDGYLCICLRSRNNIIHYRVHRLVSLVFIPNPNNLPNVHHKDKNRSNNKIENLEWVTQRKNCFYRWKTKEIVKPEKNVEYTKPTIIDDNEIWRPIKGYEQYEISNWGRIKHIKTVDSSGREAYGKIMTQQTNSVGYLEVCLYKNETGIKNHFSIHRLVALHFLEQKEDKNIVHHIDANRKNNYYKNLEWSTYKENNDYANLRHVKRGGIGEENHFSKLSEQKVKEIRNKYSSEQYTQIELSRLYNVSNSAISNIVNYKSWSHI